MSHAVRRTHPSCVCSQACDGSSTGTRVYDSDFDCRRRCLCVCLRVGSSLREGELTEQEKRKLLIRQDGASVQSDVLFRTEIALQSPVFRLRDGSLDRNTSLSRHRNPSDRGSKQCDARTRNLRQGNLRTVFTLCVNLSFAATRFRCKQGSSASAVCECVRLGTRERDV